MRGFASLLLNILWLCTVGAVLWLTFWIVGAVLCCTIIGIPFGVACFRIGNFAVLPFRR